MHQTDDRTLTDRIEECTAHWHESSIHFPKLQRRYSFEEQQENEALMDECLGELQRELFAEQTNNAHRADSYATVISPVVKLVQVALGLNHPYVRSLLEDRFAEVGRNFAQQARALDPSLGASDILQACRNVWTACGIQELLNKRVQLTPAIFAYSMLYPCTDNFLDNAAISQDAKQRFSARLRRRLLGEHLAPRGAYERMVWELVKLIEGQFERPDYPGVYGSLLAIHRAQEESLKLTRCTASTDHSDITRLIFAKGGASVLADAYLVAGDLTPQQADFAFHWGVLLQLGDDLQDLRQDCEQGILTLFVQEAERGSLEALTNQTLNFARVVCDSMDDLPEASSLVKQLLERSSLSLLIRAAGQIPELYNDTYLKQLEAYSPFRFAFLRRRETQFAGKGDSYYLRLFETIFLSTPDGTSSSAVERPGSAGY